MAESDDIKEQVAIANRVLSRVGLATGVTASLGHASMRLPSDPDKFLVKGRGYRVDALAKMRGEDMVTCDLEGFLVEGPPGASQPREVKMHSCIYKARPDVRSVVHVHPRFVVLMSVLQDRLVPMCQEGAQLVRGPLPVYPHVKTVWSEEEGAEVARLMGNSPAIILQGHGATTAGSSLAQSFITMLRLEEQARMNWYAYCAAGPDHPRIGDALLDEMTDRTPVYELPHFQGAQQPDTEGVWDYYVELVSSELE